MQSATNTIHTLFGALFFFHPFVLAFFALTGGIYGLNKNAYSLIATVLLAIGLALATWFIATWVIEEKQMNTDTTAGIASAALAFIVYCLPFVHLFRCKAGMKKILVRICVFSAGITVVLCFGAVGIITMACLAGNCI